MKIKPSIIRKKQDFILAETLVHKNKYADYEDKFNPFTEADVIRQERFKRNYEILCIKFRRIEQDFNHLMEIYGGF